MVTLKEVDEWVETLWNLIPANVAVPQADMQPFLLVPQLTKRTLPLSFG